VAAAVPVVDLLEACVAEQGGRQVVAGAGGDDAAAGLGADGDDRHPVVLGGGDGTGEVAEFGGGAGARGLDVEGVAVGAVDVSVLAHDGGDDVHRPVAVADCRPPAAVPVAGGGEPGRGDQAPGHVGPLGVAQVRVARVGAHRTHPHGA